VAAKKSAKKPATKSPPKTPTPGSLVAPAHGSGLLRYGSLPGNTPGTGRPKSEVRAAALEGASIAIPKLIEIVQNEALMRKRPNAITEAADKLLKYGLGTQKEVSVDDIKHRLARTLLVLRDELDPSALVRVMDRIKPIWAP
jgi:hypothetical protein